MGAYQMVVFTVYALMFLVTLGVFVFMIFFGNSEVPLLKRPSRASLLAQAHALCGQLPRRIRPALERAGRSSRS
jgi:hypothetical protein